jgi:Iron-sulfur cluster-binding domain
MRLDDLDVPWGEGPFRFTKRISFELSNRCDMSGQHSRCPLHRSSEAPRILRTSIIDAVLVSCRRYDFAGVIAFHLYNEPGLDPRLTWLMERIKRALPRCRLYLLTNGGYLTQHLAEEFVTRGLDYLDVSVYGESDFVRHSALQLPIRVRVLRQTLDDRLSWYAADPTRPASSAPCYCPLYEVCITCEGQVGLCPYDWQRRHLFGDLRRESIDDILVSGAVVAAYERLAAGQRDFEVCRRCTSGRGERRT